MKAYTDIEQSKKLTEILSVESADMWWSWFSNPLDNVNGGEYEKEPLLHMPVCNPENAIPCWSLAALLEVMPEILIERVKARDGYDGYYYFVTYKELIEVPYKKELIDAYYEMIIKLYEEKLI